MGLVATEKMPANVLEYMSPIFISCFYFSKLITYLFFFNSVVINLLTENLKTASAEQVAISTFVACLTPILPTN